MTPSDATPSPDETVATAEEQAAETPALVTDIKTPDGTQAVATFGFNTYAERINGRFAMVGFVALLVLEAVTHQDFFTWLGLR